MMDGFQPDGFESGFGQISTSGLNGASQPHSMTAVGTAANFYVFTSGSGTSSAKARVYQALDVILNTDGTLQVSGAPPAVPLPAAVWLLGSALVGVGAFSRRRKAAAIA
jgi:hypothetical protein